MKANHDPNKQKIHNWSEQVIEWVLASSGLLTVVTTLLIVAVILFESAEFFSEVSVADFLLDTQWTPLFAEPHFGIWPLVSGTMLTAGIAMLVALPMGLLAAIYLSQFCEPQLRAVLKPALELLAGIPTLVYGYFALVIVTPILQSWLPGLSGFNALSAGLIMGIMILPMVASLSEDALRAVPQSLREGAWALGADKFSTIWRVVIPTAASGIGASVILALSRAIGETMIVTIAAGQQPRMSLDPRGPVQTMTAYIVQVAMGDTPTGTPEYRSIFAVAGVLFLMTLSANVFSQYLTYRYRRKV